MLFTNSPLASKLDVSVTLLHNSDTQASIRRQIIMRSALWRTAWARCSQRAGDKLRYISSTAVARDIDYLTTLLDGEGSLMYVNFIMDPPVWLD
jgi:hypothetical protein